MINFIRLVDGTILLGSLIKTTDTHIIVHDALILGAVYQETVEQKYFFKGMYCPFVDSDVLESKILIDHVISMHDNLDSHLIDQYNSCVDQWYNSRSNYKKTKEYGSTLEDELEKMILSISQQSNNVH